MERFKNILLVAGGADGGRAALERAGRLAETNQARITLMDVHPEPDDEIPENPGTLSLAQVKSALIEASEEKLRELAASVDQTCDVQYRVRFGIPVVEVTREVLREEHDLVLKTADGTSGLKEFLFGPTDLHLMRKCPCPVWVLKSGSPRRFKRILAAVDPLAAEEAYHQLDDKILKLSTSLARMDDSELHVVHAWTLHAEPALRGRRGIPQAQLDAIGERLQPVHRDRLDELLERFAIPDRDERVHLVRGRPGDAVVGVARSYDIDLVVMGTVCRTGIPGFFIGNTAETVLQQVECSMLTVKPDEFVSPIRLEE